jgi:hypothetical protein
MTLFIRIIPDLLFVEFILSAKRKIVAKADAGNHKVIGAA